MNANSQTINEAFKDYFEMVPATTTELKNEVFKLRYQVYCLEIHGYDPGVFPDGMEYDEFDKHSAHYLIRHRKTNGFAATTRLILPDRQNPSGLFPLERHCVIDQPELIQAIDRRQLAEVSRFCVSKAFKQRKNEANFLTSGRPNGNAHAFTQNERRVFPHIALALFACLIRASHEHDIHYWCASMEPAFLRFISMFGVYPVKIGPISDYHGDRLPCIIKLDEMLNAVAEKNGQVWDLFTDEGRFWETKAAVA